MGAPHTNHHFVPRFLLKRWHTMPDRKLTVFRYDGDLLLHSRLSAKSVGSRPHIYSTTEADDSRDVSIERDFFGPVIDDPAAIAHSVLIEGRGSEWTAEVQEHWVRFVVSLIFRGPGTLQGIRASVRALIAKEPDLVPDSSEVIDGTTSDDGHMRWLQSHPTNLQDELAVKLLPSLIEYPALLQVFMDHAWAVRELDQAMPDLLIGDCPVIFESTGGGDYFIALPIHPRMIYVAFTNERVGNHLRDTPDEQLIAHLNHATVARAHTTVFASGAHHEALVKKHLRR